VTATDDIPNSATVVNIPGGGGSGGSGLTRPTLNNPIQDLWFYDEMYYPDPINGLLVHYETSANSFSVPNNVVGGQVKITTANVVNDIARINTCGGGLSAINTGVDFKVVFRTAVTNVNPQAAARLGAFKHQGSLPGGVFPFATPPGQVVWFKLDGTGNWFAEIDNGPTVQTIDTGVPRDIAFHVFEIRSDASVPNIEFLIDGLIVAQFTTDLPSGDFTIYEGVQTNEAGDKQLIFDSLFIFNERAGGGPSGGGGGDAGPFELLQTLTTTVQAAGITTITLDNPVLFADYSEFELIISGVSLVQANNLGIILNGLVDSTYSTQGTRVNSTPSGFFQINEGSAPKWELLDGAELLGIGKGFNIKLTLQGGVGAQLDPLDSLLGFATMSYGPSTANHGSAVMNIRKQFTVDPPQTQLISFGLKMDGLMELQSGAVFTVYGKKLVAASGGGSGKTEILLDAVVSNSAILQSFILSRPVAMDGSDVVKLVAVISDIRLSASDIVDVQFNGGSFSGTNTKGVTSDGTTVTAFNEQFGISNGQAITTLNGQSIEIELVGQMANAGGQTGNWAKFSSTIHYSHGRVDMQTGGFDPITSIQIRTRNGIVTLDAGTRIVVYAINK